MATFAPEQQYQAQDMTGYARPIPTNRGLETLFGAVGQAIEGGANAVDQSNVRQIKELADDTNTAINDQFGFGVAGALPGGTTNSSGVSNPHLNDVQANIGRVHAAFQQGAITPAMYWAKMSIAAQEARSRFPGYNDQIDQIFNNVTGHGQINSQLRNSIEHQLNSTAGAGKKFQNEFYSNAADIEMVHPGAMKEFMGGKLSDDKAQDYLADAFKFKGQNALIDAEGKRLEFRKKQNEDISSQARVLYGQNTNQIVTTAIHGVVGATGQTTNSLSDMTNAISRSGGVINEETVGKIDELMRVTELRIHDGFSKARQGAAGLSMKPEEQDALEKNAMAPFNAIANAIHNKDYGVANHLALSIKLQDETNSLALRKSNQAFAEASMLTKNGLSALLPNYEASLGKSKFANAFSPGFGAALFTGKKSLDDVTTSLLSDPNISPKDKVAGFTGAANVFVDSISSGKMEPQWVKDSIEKNFGSGASGFKVTWSNLGDEAREKLYNRLASPNFSQQVLKLNDPATTHSYYKWMVDQFGTLASVSGSKSAISGANDSSNAGDRNTWRYSYNPSTSRFDALPPATDPNGDRTRSNGSLQAVQISLDSFNNSLANIVHTMKSLGIDPNGEEGVPKVLKDLQISNPNFRGQGLIDALAGWQGKSKGVSLDQGKEIQKQDDAGAGGSVEPLGKAVGGTKGSGGSAGAKTIDGSPVVKFAASGGVQSAGLTAINESLTPADEDANNKTLKALIRPGKASYKIDNLDGSFKARLVSFMDSAPPEIKSRLRIYDGARSKDEQQYLFDHSDGSGKMVGRPEGSLHVKNKAVDLGWLTPEGKIVSLQHAPINVQNWVHSNVATKGNPSQGEHGLKLPMGYESWHIEPVETRGGGFVS